MPAHDPLVALVSSRVLTPTGVRNAAIVVCGEKIQELLPPQQLPPDIPWQDFGNAVIAPGIIDSHVHINEPGHTDWEGFQSAGQAAAAGGITTLVDMPLNSLPVVTTAAALGAKQQAARNKLTVDVGGYGGLAGNSLADLEALLDAGVFGIKAFLCDSGLPEFSAASLTEIVRAAPLLAERQVPLLVHAELGEPDPQALAKLAANPQKYQAYLDARDPLEARALQALIEALAGAPQDFHLHVVHVAGAEALRLVGDARQTGLHITAETCPHYLTLTAEEIGEGRTEFKCAPPIRGRRHGEALWQGLIDGTIDTIGSDHSPCPPELKQLEQGDFLAAWGGISSLQLTLPVVWTAARARDIGIEFLFEKLAAAPATLLGLQHSKGRIAPGMQADLCIWEPETEWIVAPAELRHRHPLTPYAGRHVTGQVIATYLAGRCVYHRDGAQPAEFAGTASPSGQWLFRGAGRTGAASAQVPLQVPSQKAAQDDAAEPRAIAQRLATAAAEAPTLLQQCCGSQRWAAAMAERIPFPTDRDVLATAAEIWGRLEQADWLEAFAAHPQIGDLATLRTRYADTRQLAAAEQGQVASASEGTLTRLAELNQAYLERFGFLFIVCATGKSADAMLALLEERLPNSREVELANAGREQLGITLLRLRKLGV